MALNEHNTLTKIKALWQGKKFKKDNFLIMILLGVLLLVVVWPAAGPDGGTDETETGQSGILDNGSDILNLGGGTDQGSLVSDSILNQEGGMEGYSEYYGQYLERRLEEVIGVMEG
ncbi:MAG: hypothetical protein LBV33_05365, partial [Lachnospiraceae bacterium]|nr:hypothetical protein [Lachnospiraceae bacterium]